MKFLIIILALPICIFSNPNIKNDDSQKVSSINVLSSNSQIIYLLFSVKKTNSGSEKITLDEKIVTKGKLKLNSNYDENQGEIGDFIVSLTNESGKELIKQIVENPLNPTREVYSENEISRIKLSLQNADFSIRYAHSPEIVMVKIEKITKSGNQLLFIQKL